MAMKTVPKVYLCDESVIRRPDSLSGSEAAVTNIVQHN